MIYCLSNNILTLNNGHKRAQKIFTGVVEPSKLCVPRTMPLKQFVCPIQAAYKIFT